MCNPSKTEVIQFSSCFVKNPILRDFFIGNARVQPSDRVCNLGVNLDRELNLSHHINETCLKAMLAIRFIGRLRKYLSKDHLKMMDVFVMSRLDYCNCYTITGLTQARNRQAATCSELCCTLGFRNKKI